MKILRIDSSITGEASVSRQLTSRLVAHILASNPEAQLQVRDLVAAPLPLLDGQIIRTLEPGSSAPGADRARQVLAEFLDADIVLVGAPMYNFGVPAQLKTWIDYLSVPGATFRYTAAGVEGLAGGRQVIIISSRGGVYAPGSPVAAMEHQESYLRTVFAFFGITDVTVVRAEGLRVSPEMAEAAIKAADDQIVDLKIGALVPAPA